MKERPILFSAPMVRALLVGMKTVTRRIVKLAGCTIDSRADGSLYVARTTRPKNETSFEAPCPYGNVGDRLWVKEAIALNSPWAEGTQSPGHDSAIYVADESPTTLDTWPWKRDRLPGMFMPRGLSRITLEVTSVKVERLHDITEEDAAREGVTPFPDDPEGDCWTNGKHRTAFEYLWNEINGWEPNSWAANPWVWAVGFKRIEDQ